MKAARVDDAAKEAGKDPYDFVFDLLIAERAAASAACGSSSTKPTSSWRCSSPGCRSGRTDRRSPRAAAARRSAAPAQLRDLPASAGQHVREEHVISLELAVHKMTGLTAGQMHIGDRGLIKEGLRGRPGHLRSRDGGRSRHLHRSVSVSRRDRDGRRSTVNSSSTTGDTPDSGRGDHSRTRCCGALVWRRWRWPTACASAADAQPLGRLRGRVVTTMGSPVDGASVGSKPFTASSAAITPDEDVRIRADAKGEWALIGFKAGVWIFEASAPGRLPDVIALPINVSVAPSVRRRRRHTELAPVLRLSPIPDTPAGESLKEAADAALADRTRSVRTVLARPRRQQRRGGPRRGRSHLSPSSATR